MNDIDREILNLIRARYPVIVVESHEEARVCEAIWKIALEIDTHALARSASEADIDAHGEAAQQTRVFHWTVSRGLEQVVPAPGEKPNGQPQHAAPPQVLNFISEFGRPTDEHPQGPRAIFVLKVRP